jgi:hypothetical protein
VGKDGYIGSVYDFTPSADFHDAWALVRKIEPLITRFNTADGYVFLQSAHFGSHGLCIERKQYWTDEEDNSELDPRPWSFHIHMGLIGEEARPLVPAWWGTVEGTWSYCEFGATEQECICKTLIAAYTPPVEGFVEDGELE